ncbi:MAG: hypothetical protein ABEJ66_03680, partial [Candidatus Nanohaloarchaea archaeon]
MAEVGRKGQWNVFFIIVVFIIIGGLPLFVAGLSGIADVALQQKVQALQPPRQAKTLAGHLSENMPEAVNWSIYQASYATGQSGGGSGWSPSGIPSIQSVENTYEKNVEDIFLDYFGHQISQGICRLSKGGYDIEVTDRRSIIGGEQGLNLSLDAKTPLNVTCWIKGANTSVYLAPPKIWKSKRNRLFRLYNVSRALAKSQGFRNATAHVLWESGMYIVATKKDSVGTCTSSHCSETYSL